MISPRFAWADHVGFQIVLVVIFGLAIQSLIHESGHWFGYRLVGVDSSIGWLETTPDLELLTAGKNLVGLHFGLLFQLLPGAIAWFYLAKIDGTSKTALAVLIASWLIRTFYILLTFLMVGLFIPSWFSGSGPRLGDEWEIQRILLGQTGPVLAWIVALGLAVIPAVLFVVTQWKLRSLWANSEWCIISVAEFLIIIGIAWKTA